MARRKEESILPVPKTGPSMTLRMRSKEQIEQIQRAAAKANLSTNTWAVEVLARASEAQK